MHNEMLSFCQSQTQNRVTNKQKKEKKHPKMFLANWPNSPNPKLPSLKA